MDLARSTLSPCPCPTNKVRGVIRTAPPIVEKERVTIVERGGDAVGFGEKARPPFAGSIAQRGQHVDLRF